MEYLTELSSQYQSQLKKIEEQKKLLEQKELEVCTFKPQTNKRISKLNIRPHLDVVKG